MLFAAGIGARLRPLTNDRPKALVEVNGTPLLEIAIRRLQRHGVEAVIINVHHFGRQIIDFLAEKENFGIQIAISDERGQLLDTGGGLKKAAWFFTGDEPFGVMNTDILTDLDLGALYQAHLASGALATLAVRKRASSRYLLFDEQDRLCGWRNERTGEEKWARPLDGPVVPLAFSGIQVVSPALFGHFPQEAAFSIIDTYLTAARTDEIRAFRHDHTLWMDVGKPERLREASRLLAEWPAGRPF